MGKVGKEILGIDVKKLIKLLNSALADEWLAYYQYWLGAKLAVGPMKGEVAAELLEHANDELRHAGMIADRIVILGGEPVLDPKDWPKVANCKYAAPKDPHVKKLLEQNVEGERCAIRFYKKLLDMTLHKDPVTYQMVYEIMKDEIEHEDDLEALQEDLKNIK